MRLHERTIPGVPIPATLALSACGIIIASSFVVGGVLGVVQSATEDSVVSDQANVIGKILEDNPIMERSQSRFTGRSIFYIPKEPRRPSPPKPPPPPRVEEEPAPTPPPQPPPSAPSKYAGPGIRGILGNEVFFESGKRVKVGDSADGVDVLRINNPFSLRLGWKRGEYEVNLFAEEIPDFFGKAPYEGSSASTLLSLETMTTGSLSQSERDAAQARELKEIQDREAREARNRQNDKSQSEKADVPAALAQSDVDEMSRIDAIRAMSSIGRALRQEVDEQTKKRLEEERTMLREHIRNNSGAE